MSIPPANTGIDHLESFTQTHLSTPGCLSPPRNAVSPLSLAFNKITRPLTVHLSVSTSKGH